MEQKIFFSKHDDKKMIAAYIKAQDTFKYFWRELYWEHRRIVAALDVAYVKVAFSQHNDSDNEPIVEHMWIKNIGFDGNNIRGVLINDPNKLTNVANGDSVEIPLAQVSDWLFSIRGETYGGFTIQVIRSEMTSEERQKHDEAWGLNFGDCNDILLVYGQKEHPENLIEHPMSKNMKEKFATFLTENPDKLILKDDKGYSILHKETIAGNGSTIEVLKQFKVNIHDMTNSGKTAIDFARNLNWAHIIPLLENND